MTDHSTRDDAVDSGEDLGAVDAGEPTAAGVDSTESYEQDDLVVLYDAENPLAWIEADSAVRVERMA